MFTTTFLSCHISYIFTEPLTAFTGIVGMSEFKKVLFIKKTELQTVATDQLPNSSRLQGGNPIYSGLIAEIVNVTL